MPRTKKRDIFELNKFQEQILGPFYVSCLFVVIFLGAVGYLFFFPQTHHVQEMVVLNQCETNIPAIVTSLSVASMVISLIGMFLINRIHQQQLKASSSIIEAFDPSAIRSVVARGTQVETATVVAGIACLLAVISLFCLAYLLLGGGNIGEDKENFYFLLQNGLNANKSFFIFTALSVVLTIAALFYWSYSIAHKILGPYERILRELDSMVGMTEHKSLKVRDGDEMFGELIKRINLLLKQRK